MHNAASICNSARYSSTTQSKHGTTSLPPHPNLPVGRRCGVQHLVGAPQRASGGHLDGFRDHGSLDARTQFSMIHSPPALEPYAPGPYTCQDMLYNTCNYTRTGVDPMCPSGPHQRPTFLRSKPRGDITLRPTIARPCSTSDGFPIWGGFPQLPI
jgi:hypothetical protein